MADDWEMEAVGEQFKVFDSLKVSSCSINPYDNPELVRMVDNVIKRHWRANLEKRSTREIVVEIIKNSHGDKNTNCSFIVIITNQSVNKRLSKIPIFTIQFVGKCSFIDMNGSVYKTWDTFLKSNDLPACKLCFPVNGQYDVGNKLKIDFAASPVLQSFLRWRLIGCGVLAGGFVVACSFFFKNPLIRDVAYSLGKKLLPYADRFLNRNEMKIIQQVLLIGELIERLKCSSKISLIEFISCSTKFLQNLNSIFKADDHALWKEVALCLKDAYDCIHNIVINIYNKSSDLLKYLFFVITGRVDSKVRALESDVEKRLNDVTENKQTQDSVHLREEVIKGQTPGKTRIFDNCINEWALQCSMKNKSDKFDNVSDSRSFHPNTQDLLKISANLANQAENLNDMQDIFESISVVITEEYKDKMDSYIKMVAAAKIAAKGDIDMNIFNETLGIFGDPKTHYWNEAVVQFAHKRRFAFQMKMMIEELKKNKKIFLTPLWKKTEDDILGLYKITGIQRAGKFSADALLNVIKEYVYLNENKLVINETQSLIYIQSEKTIIMAQQELDEENTSLGVVYIDKQSD